MSALVIPQVAKYETVLPSSGKKVTFRPFTVKEEKFLLQARETKKTKDIEDVIMNLLKACVETPFNRLTVLDCQWLFLQLRAKSVSDEIEFVFKCNGELDNGSNCRYTIEEVIKIEDIKYEGKPECQVELEFENGKYIVGFGQPLATEKIEDEKDGLYSRLTMIIQPDGTMFTKEMVSKNEFVEFLNAMSLDQYVKVAETIKDNIISLNYVVEGKCPVCGKEYKMVLRTLEDFFI